MKMPRWFCVFLSIVFYLLAACEAWMALGLGWAWWDNPTASTQMGRDGLVAMTFYLFAGFTFGSSA